VGETRERETDRVPVRQTTAERRREGSGRRRGRRKQRQTSDFVLVFTF